MFFVCPDGPVGLFDGGELFAEFLDGGIDKGIDVRAHLLAFLDHLFELRLLLLDLQVQLICLGEKVLEDSALLRIRVCAFLLLLQLGEYLAAGNLLGRNRGIDNPQAFELRVQCLRLAIGYRAQLECGLPLRGYVVEVDVERHDLL